MTDPQPETPLDRTRLPRTKYPRTPHLPWSPGRSDDDKVQHDLSALRAAPGIVMTLKMDGEATTMYPDGTCHARSVDSGPHPSRTTVRALAAQIGPDIPAGWRVCGENMYATHSIAYADLPGFFLAYSIWDRDLCLPWSKTQEWAALLGLPVVPVLYRGPLPDERGLAALFAPHAHAHEGYVVRDAGSFRMADFGQRVAKFVRPGHVTTSQHWSRQAVRVNGVRASRTA